MDIPLNQFKRRLIDPGAQFGIWCSLADPVTSEIAATAGFDFLTIDAEHGPNDLRTVLAQLQATAAYPTSVIVRVSQGDTALIKQVMDIGAQTIVVPMVETADQARQMVAAVRYPPAGVRGVSTARAARWGRVENYFARANDEACLVLQIESAAGLDNIEEIAAVDGVDALFVGPSDLGASLGYLGQADHADVRQIVNAAIHRINATGKASGVLAQGDELIRTYLDAGAGFVAVGVDTYLLAAATKSLADRWKGN